MIAVVAKLKIREGRNAEFEAFFRGLMASVRANEPGCRLYQASKSRTDPQVYCVQELYDDAAAQEAHRASEHVKAAGPTLVGFFAERPAVESFDTF